jgi:hypothetical protein
MATCDAVPGAAIATLCLLGVLGCRHPDERRPDVDAAPPTSPSAPVSFKSEDAARAELREFLSFSADCGNAPLPRIPRRVDPSLVRAVLSETISAGRLGASKAWRYVDLARFYGVSSVVTEWIALLDGRARDKDEVLGTLALVTGVAALGDEAQWKRAQAYYHDVLSRPFAEAHVSQILDCYACLVPREDPGATRERIERIAARMAPTQAGKLRQALHRIEAWGSLLARIEAIPDPDARIDRVVDAYLELDPAFRDLEPWVTGVEWAEWTLLWEAHHGGATTVVGALRRSLPRIREPFAEVMHSRAAHAIEFFGDATPEERAYLRAPYKVHDDLLTVE